MLYFNEYQSHLDHVHENAERTDVRCWVDARKKYTNLMVPLTALRSVVRPFGVLKDPKVRSEVKGCRLEWKCDEEGRPRGNLCDCYPFLRASIVPSPQENAVPLC